MSEPSAPFAAARANSMSPEWCTARVAEARAWRDANSKSTPGWQHVHELLSQHDNPPAPPLAASVGGETAPIEQLLAVLRTEDAPPGFASFRTYLLGRGPALIQALTNLIARAEKAESIAEQECFAAAGLWSDLQKAEAELAAARARLSAVQGDTLGRGNVAAIPGLSSEEEQNLRYQVERCPLPERTSAVVKMPQLAVLLYRAGRGAKLEQERDAARQEAAEAKREKHQLHEELRGLRAGWVPVAERLPEDGKVKIVACLTEVNPGQFRQIVLMRTFYYDEDQCAWVRNGQGDSDGKPTTHNITHWQNLPAAPEFMQSRTKEEGREGNG